MYKMVVSLETFSISHKACSGLCDRAITTGHSVYKMIVSLETFESAITSMIACTRPGDYEEN